MKNAQAGTENRRTMTLQSIVYALPQAGIALLMGPVAVVLGGIYAKHYGLAFTSIASVILISRLFDAVTDPLIGYYSDRWRARTGSRKFFIALGGALVVPCSYYLFLPPAEVSTGYFAFWYIAFYLALTLFFIPYMAWANEFTVDSEDKTYTFSAMAIGGQAGGALFYLLPLLPLFASTDITPEVLKMTVVFGAALFLPCLYLALKVVPNGSLPVAASQTQAAVGSDLSIKQQIFVLLAALISNRPFLLFVMAFMCLGMGAGMWMSMFFIYVDTYLMLGELFAKLSLWSLLCGAVAIPVWYRASLYLGKRNAWLVGMFLLTIAFFYTGFLQPGLAGYTSLFVLSIMVYFAVASMGVIALPMLCDVIDYGRLRDKSERNALYFSVYALMTKLQVAIGGAFGMAIVGWFGFDAQAIDHSELSLVGLRISVAWAPSVLMLLAMVFIALMPLNERRMAAIRRRLTARDKRILQASFLENRSSGDGTASGQLSKSYDRFCITGVCNETNYEATHKR